MDDPNDAVGNAEVAGEVVSKKLLFLPVKAALEEEEDGTETGGRAKTGAALFLNRLNVVENEDEESNNFLLLVLLVFDVV